MTFQAFEQAVAAEPLKRVARHWNEVRGERAVPEWGDIRPSALAAQLSIIWSWKYDPVTDQFTGRLAGDAIEAVFGRSLRAAAMTDVFRPADYIRLFGRHKRVTTEPALFHGTGLVFHHIDRYGTGERVIFPLADGIFGATVYEATVGPLPGGLAEAGEKEAWFALD